VHELRQVAALLAGAAAPAVLILYGWGVCSASDVCLVQFMALFFGVPAGAVSGVVAAVVAPRDDGWAGFGFAAFGIPLGVAATLTVLGNPQGIGSGVQLFGPPVLVGLGLAYGITRFLRRGPDVTSTPSAPGDDRP
jgi:hypothetical protein